jgi:DNA (cytosine-5)-methyltransferase 1
MRNGKVYELPMLGPRITDSEFSSLPTPAARDYKDGIAEHERDGVVQTDTVARAIFNSGEVLLPTTRTSMANGPTQKEIKAGNPKTRIETEVMLMPTPTTGDTTGGGKSELDRDDPKHRLKIAAKVLARNKMQWGKFETAIRRWEQTLGRPAPLPTKPDGRDGHHRLSSKFTEWMMGLPEGWVTGVGLTRNEELKACGNGVVPQQAELALRLLLANSDLVKENTHEN